MMDFEGSAQLSSSSGYGLAKKYFGGVLLRRAAVMQGILLSSFVVSAPLGVCQLGCIPDNPPGRNFEFAIVVGKGKGEGHRQAVK